MTETQLIFRVDEKLLKKLDTALKVSGFKTRNEWFRHAIRNFLEEIERKNAIKLVDKLTVAGLSEEDVALMVKEWREGRKKFVDATNKMAEIANRQGISKSDVVKASKKVGKEVYAKLKD